MFYKAFGSDCRKSDVGVQVGTYATPEFSGCLLPLTPSWLDLRACINHVGNRLENQDIINFGEHRWHVLIDVTPIVIEIGLKQ